MGWFDSITEGIPGIGDSLSSTGQAIYDFLPEIGSGGDSGGGGFDLGSLLTNGNFLASLVTSGAGLFQGMSQIDANKEALKRQEENDKFQYLLELAKLKYAPKGGGGGGGGTRRNRNADLIEILNAETEQKSDALNNMAKNYNAAVKI